MDNLILIGINECGEEEEIWRGNLPPMPVDVEGVWKDYFKEQLIRTYIPERSEWQGFYWEDRSSWGHYIAMGVEPWWF